jgi:hypothetical protein
MTTEQHIAALLENKGTSRWLRRALIELLERDACDAAADAEELAHVMGLRACEALDLKAPRRDFTVPVYQIS